MLQAPQVIAGVFFLLFDFATVCRNNAGNEKILYL